MKVANLNAIAATAGHAIDHRYNTTHILLVSVDRPSGARGAEGEGAFVMPSPLQRCHVASHPASDSRRHPEHLGRARPTDRSAGVSS
jgi:hypothetical protein